MRRSNSKRTSAPTYADTALPLSVFLSASVATGVVIATMLAILLFGTSEQSDKALAILKVIGIGSGGFGIGYAVLSAFRGLSRR